MTARERLGATFVYLTLGLAILLSLAYPLLLLPLGFYSPAERRAIGARLRLAR